jgi:hypothetical protein
MDNPKPRYSQTENLVDEIQCKGTPGVGDFMFALNVAHTHAYYLQKKVKLTFNWYWNVREKYHFEDPELTIERLDYIHKYYKDKDSVEIEHVYDSENWKVYHGFYSQPTDKVMRAGYIARMGMSNWWEFDPKHILPNATNKVVFWRDTFNADVVRKWKRLIDHYGWDKMMDNFYNNGYDPVELTYRTPVREAMYHINTAQFIVCYDGLWHYMAKNFHKPLIVLSRSAITRLHTPEALTIDEKDYSHYSRNFGVEKRRDIIFPKINKVDRYHNPGKRLKIHGDGLLQLKTRINLYKKLMKKCQDDIRDNVQAHSRQSSN